MQRLRISFLLATTILATGANAQVLEQPATTPITQQSGQYADTPRPGNGLTMAQVEQRFGVPKEKVPAVGDPPISRWVYDHFTVYFEYDKVLHSVVNKP